MEWLISVKSVALFIVLLAVKLVGRTHLLDLSASQEDGDEDDTPPAPSGNTHFQRSHLSMRHKQPQPKTTWSLVKCFH